MLRNENQTSDRLLGSQLRLTPQQESLYQEVAGQAIACFPDVRDLERQFAHLTMGPEAVGSRSVAERRRFFEQLPLRSHSQCTGASQKRPQVSSVGAATRAAPDAEDGKPASPLGDRRDGDSDSELAECDRRPSPQSSSRTQSRQLGSTTDDEGFAYDEWRPRVTARMLGVDPDRVQVLGSALRSGIAKTDNVFLVRTHAGAGPGFLTIGVHGAAGNASLVSQSAVDESTYEVRYRVSRPGYYMIFVRWSDCSVRDSPFVCLVSDPSAC